MTLVWIPRAELVTRLLEAKSASDRFVLLVEERLAIADDCEQCIEEIDAPALSYVVATLLEAVRNLREGNWRSSQIVSGSIVTHVVQQLRRHGRFDEARRALESDKPNDETLMIDLRGRLVTSPVPSALEQFRPDKGEPIPTTFNRHALAHGVFREQLSEENAVAGVMLATALLREEQARANDE